MPDESLPLLTRIWLAWVCYFRVLFDGAFAARVLAARAELPAAREEKPKAIAPAPTPAPKGADVAPALQLLALLQREGRFLDFVEQDVSSFSDADIGAAARVVHDGCRKALHAHATIEAVRNEEEGAKVTLEAGFDASQVKLTGDVRGAAPYEGVLRHRGWRAKGLKLPTAVDGHDASILAPAELEV